MIRNAIKNVLLFPFVAGRGCGAGCLRGLLGWRGTAWSDDEYKETGVVFAPHQDDETLGCGAALIRKKRAGALVQVVFTTDGSSSHPGLIGPEELAAMRKQEALAACKVLGVPAEDVRFLDFPDGRLSLHAEAATARIIEIISSVRPAQVFVPYYFLDGPPDHQATTRSVLAAVAAVSSPAVIYEYPVWAWYYWPWTGLDEGGFRALKVSMAMNRSLLRDCRSYVPVADIIELKRQALNQHRSQVEQLVQDPQWTTLGGVADGDWLACFFQKREFYYRHPLQPVPPAAGK